MKKAKQEIMRIFLILIIVALITSIACGFMISQRFLQRVNM